MTWIQDQGTLTWYLCPGLPVPGQAVLKHTRSGVLHKRIRYGNWVRVPKRLTQRGKKGRAK